MSSQWLIGLKAGGWSGRPGGYTAAEPIAVAAGIIASRFLC